VHHAPQQSLVTGSDQLDDSRLRPWSGEELLEARFFDHGLVTVRVAAFWQKVTI
jgi:hypothetical protein